MLTFNPVMPQFGAKLKPAQYYTTVRDIYNTLRPVASLRVISQHLNAANLTTPTGLPFNRVRLANFIRGSAPASATQ